MSPRAAQRFLHPSLDHLHDPFKLADMARGGGADSCGDRAEGAHRRSRRLRLRRHHVDGDSPPRARDVRRDRRALSFPSALKDGYGLQPETFDRLQADGVHAGDFGGLRHSGHRGGAARARARASISSSPTITSPMSELPAAVAVINPQAPRLRLSGQESGRRRRGAEAGSGAVPQARSRAVAAGVHQGRGDRHARRRRAAGRRESRHREARARHAVAGSAQGRTARAAGGRRAERESRSTAGTWRFRLRRA